jgi:uncharacterized protein
MVNKLSLKRQSSVTAGTIDLPRHCGPADIKGFRKMRALNLVTLLLIIVGGINWLLVAALFGDQQAMLSKVVYVLVGLLALYQLVPFSKAFSIGEQMAEGRVVR